MAMLLSEDVRAKKNNPKSTQGEELYFTVKYFPFLSLCSHIQYTANYNETRNVKVMKMKTKIVKSNKSINKTLIINSTSKY